MDQHISCKSSRTFSYISKVTMDTSVLTGVVFTLRDERANAGRDITSADNVFPLI